MPPIQLFGQQWRTSSDDLVNTSFDNINIVTTSSKYSFNFPTFRCALP